MLTNAESVIPQTNTKGILAVLAAMFFYAGTYVGARYGIKSTLTAYDITAIRFGVAGILLLPFLWQKGLRTLGGIGWRRGILLACLAGAPYVMLIYSGLRYAPASHAAAINAGVVPFVATFGMWFIIKTKITIGKITGLCTIALGLWLLTSVSFAQNPMILWGHFLFFLAGLFWGTFLVLVRVWELKASTVTAAVAVLSLIYLPFYFFIITSSSFSNYFAA